MYHFCLQEEGHPLQPAQLTQGEDLEESYCSGMSRPIVGSDELCDRAIKLVDS